MFLTCEKCQIVWRLDEKHLALGGRVVRCTSCGNTWFEEQVTVPGLTPEPEAAPQSFTDILAEEMETGGPSRAVAPIAVDDEIPVIDYRPAGLGANAFGAMAFLLLFFVTVSAVFLLKNPLVKNYPAMTALYEAVGVGLHAPGEGLSLSALAARERAGRILLTGKVSNIGERAVDYPAFRVILRGEEGVFLKDWSIFSKPARLAPGETVPLELNFKDIPAGGSTVDIRVIGR
ncbi:MAG: zinc-ribbon domain-containing protein [Alphaproteobacteria bacterium]